MSAPTYADLQWFHSHFRAQCRTYDGTPWQDFVSNAMSARHGGDFLQVDPAGRGDKGCDGYVGGLMLACYGASSPNQRDVTNKVNTDFAKAHAHWGSSMNRWAFVHNNAAGLPDMAVAAVIALRAANTGAGVAIEAWPPQVLWDEAFVHLTREQLCILLGQPPAPGPASMPYIAQCVRALARTQRVPVDGPVPVVPHGKIEHNEFGAEVAAMLVTQQAHTSTVQYYFSQASPGEQDQVAETLRFQYHGHRARLGDSDAVFHAMCDELTVQASENEMRDTEPMRRAAAMLVLTHFFETCQIFEEPPRRS